MPCARFLEADWLTHGHVTRARDCHVVVTRSAALSSCDNLTYQLFIAFLVHRLPTCRFKEN